MNPKISSGKALIALCLLLVIQFACARDFSSKGSGKVAQVEKQPSTINSSSGMTEYEVVGLVNVRSCPSTTCAVIGNLDAGKIVEGACGSGKWCRILYENKNAWVFAPCLGQEGICK